jgi:trimethylamine--corrinoid protein Co-methyltransferase
MRVNYQTNAGTQFRLLSDDQLEEMFEATLRVMEEIGLDVHNEEARQILGDNGASVEGLRVRIPSYMVTEALATAPRSFTIWARDGDAEKNIHIGAGRPYYGPGPTCPNFLDPHTGQRRRYLRKDASAVAKVCDALPNIDFCESLGTVSDVHPELGATYEFAEMFPNTSKPIVAWSYDWQDGEDIHKMAVAAAGGQKAFEKRPNYVHYCEPLSPLVSSEEALNKLIFAAEHRVPLIFTPCPSAGGTAPSTMASVLIQAAAESWMGLVVAQLISPGLPFFMGGVVSIMDMKTTVLAYGAPELSLLQAGLTELAHYVGLPLWTTGGCTDAKVIDEQAALEGTLSVLFAGLSGGDLCHDVGYIESGLTGSLQQLVLMNEAIGHTKRIRQGIEVTPETLAVEVIRDVGPGGHFLGEKHTLNHFREFWSSELIDRNKVDDWEAAGSPTLGDRVQQKLIEILETYQPPALPEGVPARIEEVLAEAEARVAE